MNWFSHLSGRSAKPKQTKPLMAEPADSTATPQVVTEMKTILTNWKLNDDVQTPQQLLSNYVVPRR